MRDLLTLLATASAALSLTACAEGGQRTGAIDTWDEVSSQDTVAQDTAVAQDTTTGRVPLKHRAEAVDCDHERVDNLVDIPDNPGAPVDCTAHTDCTDGDNGRCVGNSHDGWYCTYDLCFSDDDCGASPKVCECGGGFRADNNVCLQGGCRLDADCGANGYCSPSFGDCGDYLGVVAYYCHTAADECVDDADCGDTTSTFGGPYCAYNPTAGKWMCSSQHCAG